MKQTSTPPPDLSSNTKTPHKKNLPFAPRNLGQHTPNPRSFPKIFSNPPNMMDIISSPEDPLLPSSSPTLSERVLLGCSSQHIAPPCLDTVADGSSQSTLERAVEEGLAWLRERWVPRDSLQALARGMLCAEGSGASVMFTHTPVVRIMLPQKGRYTVIIADGVSHRDGVVSVILNKPSKTLNTREIRSSTVSKHRFSPSEVSPEVLSHALSAIDAGDEAIRAVLTSVTPLGSWGWRGDEGSVVGQTEGVVAPKVGLLRWVKRLFQTTARGRATDATKTLQTTMQDVVKSAWGRRSGGLTVEGVLHIEHSGRLSQYHSHLRKLQKEVASRGRPNPPIVPSFGGVGEDAETCTEVNEVWLFHGTRQDRATQIIMNGMDEKASRGGLHGAGIYFAEDAGKANKYMQPDSSGLCDLFLCRVLLGRACPVRFGARSTCAQAPCIEGHHPCTAGHVVADSVLAMVHGYAREFVVYTGAAVFPEYLLRVRRSASP